MQGYIDLEDNVLKEKLENARTIAVVGLSSNPSRPSYGVAQYLQKNNYKIYPVNPNEESVLGELSYHNLSDLPEIPDIVDVFRRSEHVEPLVDECISLGVKFIFFQLGVVNIKAIKKAQENGIAVVADKCLLVEHRRLGL